jgi:hypothetical protein
MDLYALLIKQKYVMRLIADVYVSREAVRENLGQSPADEHDWYDVADNENTGNIAADEHNRHSVKQPTRDVTTVNTPRNYK